LRLLSLARNRVNSGVGQLKKCGQSWRIAGPDFKNLTVGRSRFSPAELVPVHKRDDKDKPERAAFPRPGWSQLISGIIKTIKENQCRRAGLVSVRKRDIRIGRREQLFRAGLDFRCKQDNKDRQRETIFEGGGGLRP
jgi:hypothetical protein